MKWASECYGKAKDEQSQGFCLQSPDRYEQSLCILPAPGSSKNQFVAAASTGAARSDCKTSAFGSVKGMTCYTMQTEHQAVTVRRLYFNNLEDFRKLDSRLPDSNFAWKFTGLVKIPSLDTVFGTHFAEPNAPPPPQQTR